MPHFSISKRYHYHYHWSRHLNKTNSKHWFETNILRRNQRWARKFQCCEKSTSLNIPFVGSILQHHLIKHFICCFFGVTKFLTIKSGSVRDGKEWSVCHGGRGMVLYTVYSVEHHRFFGKELAFLRYTLNGCTRGSLWLGDRWGHPWCDKHRIYCCIRSRIYTGGPVSDKPTTWPYNQVVFSNALKNTCSQAI